MGIFSRLLGKKKDKDSDKTTLSPEINISKESKPSQSHESTNESDKTKGQDIQSAGGLKINDKIDNNYEIRKIFEGGMGYVYICHDQLNDEIVAVKTLNDKLFQNEKFTKKFYQEAQTWLDLGKQKNIVQAKSAFKVNDRPYIVLENVVGDKEKGPDLKDWIKSGELDLKTSLSLSIQICLGLDCASNKFNEMGKIFVHRDIKPANILITHDKVAKITDFGIAKIYEDEEESFKEGEINVKGDKTDTVSGLTPAYASPEQWMGLRDIDIRSDIYSFGCVLYEMITGEKLFDGPNIYNYQAQHLKVTPSQPKEKIKDTHEKLNNLIIKCLEKERANRYCSFEELIEELREIYKQQYNEEYKIDTTKEQLEGWELVNKGLSFSNLDMKDKATNCFKEALEADPASVLNSIQRITRRGLQPLEDLQDKGLILGTLRNIFFEFGEEELTGKAEEILEKNKISYLKQLNKIGGLSQVLVKTLQGHTGSVLSVAVSGDTIISGSKDNTVRVWNIKTGECLKTLRGHTDQVNSVALSGDTVISGSDDKTVRVWNIKKGECVKTLEGHIRSVTSVAILGDMVISGSWDTVHVWNIKTGECLKTLQDHSCGIESIAISGDTVIYGRWTTTIPVWNIKTGECIKTLDGYSEGHTGRVTSVAISGDAVVSGSEDNTVRVWNIKIGGLSSALVKTLHGHTDWVTNVAVSGDTVISGSKDKTVRVWNIKTGECIKTLQGHTDQVNSVAVSGDTVISGSDDNTLRVWNIKSGKCLGTFYGLSRIKAVKFYDNNTKILAYDSGGSSNYVPLKYELELVNF